jgi:hypothetical protein
MTYLAQLATEKLEEIFWKKDFISKSKLGHRFVWKAIIFQCHVAQVQRSSPLTMQATLV